MVEGDRLERRRARGVGRLVEREGTGGHGGVGVKPSHEDRRVKRREGRLQLRDRRDAVVVDAVEAVPVDRDQNLRLDLYEPIDHAACTEIGGARRPDRSEACRSQHSDHRLGDVREIGGHAVAAPNAEIA
jgi:hypothetical protein